MSTETPRQANPLPNNSYNTEPEALLRTPAPTATHLPPTQTLTVQTWNVMGTTIIIQELADMVADKPDILILTNTKLTSSTQDRRISWGLSGCQIWTEAASMQRIGHVNTPLSKGHAVGLKIQSSHSDPLTVWGVYMPFEVPHRAEIYDHLCHGLTDTPFAIVGETRMPPSSRLTGKMAQDSARNPEKTM